MSASLARPIMRSQPRGGHVTAELIPQAEADLQLLQHRTGLSRTDLVNRAIALYEFIDAQFRAGRDLILRDTRTRETRLVRFA